MNDSREKDGNWQRENGSKVGRYQEQPYLVI